MYHRRFLIFTGVTVSAIMFKLTLLFVLIGSNSVKGEIAKTYIDCLDGGYPGRSSTLVCRVNGTVKYGIRLFRATGEQVVFCGLDHTDCFKTTGMTGYSATIDQTTKDVTLTITSFNIEMDVGTWTCTDGVKTGAVGTTCNKTVLTGPANITLIPPEPGEVTEGQSLDVTCDADCNPPCSFSWMLEQTEISNSSQLRLDNVKLNQNREVYTCIANNSKIPKSESINFTLTVKEERSTTSVPTTNPNLGSGSGCNLVCIILITVISVTGLCIIITCCLISLRNQNTKKNDKTTNIELNSKMNIEKSQTEVSVDIKAEENCNIQEITDKKHDTEDVETSQSVKDRIANESSHNMSGNHGSDEDNESSEDYSYNQTNVKPANQPVSKYVYKELTKSEVCQQSVTDSLNKTDVSNNTAESQHLTRQNYNNVDQQKTKHVTTIDVKIKL